MSRERLLIDTNILIYLSGGDVRAAELLVGFKPVISVITEIELLSKPDIAPAEELELDLLSAACEVIALDDRVKRKCIEIIRQHRMTLPDAVIAATAIVHSLPLVTADRSFSRIPSPLVAVIPWN